ncbi:quinon protein alcohol dehydrogenase-like superfamily [Cokeromyces recurvatus]|uniref:quinon protein alcohol dehydrogenase-like superfamily n=1 Tax=Cokeromyces recurvatus TaxID=90255 RepID=UPI00221FB89F|nr:quinon protein alcohol dehydrogenase-like superfamily [Cokeromyces recurvatus]KAI7905857.1 quinon protein alcohol dehydrogenase-like superfamily [Cokeromyces recurvatus]
MTCTTKAPKHCYRHNPELMKIKNKDEFDIEQLQEELAFVPEKNQSQIALVWNIFQQSSKEERLLILKGILASACTPQLSFIANTVKPLLCIDFTTIFPTEITKQIFSLLDATSLCSAAQVSKHWKSLADDDTLWHRMCEQHINRKCTKCGWGLPLLQKRKVVFMDHRLDNTRKRSHSSNTACDNQDQKRFCPDTSYRKSWKDIYSERLIIERNWRNNYTTKRVLKRVHQGGISCLQFCESQNILITGSYDKTAIVWNLETGQVLRVLKGHARCIRTLQADDTKLVTGSMDNTLRIWNYHTGQCIRILEGHTDGVVHLNFNCRILASGSADATIKIWNFQTGECFTLAGHTKSVNHVSIHKMSPLLVSSSDDHTIRIWDLEKRACVRILKGHMAPVQTAIPSMPGFLHCFIKNSQLKSSKKGRRSNNSNSSSSSDEDEDNSNMNKLNIVSASTTTTTNNNKTRYYSSNKTNDDCIRSSEQVVISGSLDHTIKIWSLESGECLQTLFGHVQGIWSLAYDKLRMVSGSHDGTLKLWDIESGLPMYCLEGHNSAVTAVALSDTKIVSADDEGNVHVWDFGM